jgi:hypothetical protein
MQRFLFVWVFFSCLTLRAQQERKYNPAGILSLGGRTTVSLFNDDKNEMTGTGVGGQFRLRFSDAVNTDWFFDYITSDILNYAHRTDYRIGWSVLFYPMNHLAYFHQPKDFKPKFRPYILAGHCFDPSRIEAKEGTSPMNGAMYAERWSSAVQAGSSFYFSKYCHFFAEINFSNGWIRRTPLTSVSLAQYGISAGLGFHLITQKHHE